MELVESAAKPEGRQAYCQRRCHRGDGCYLGLGFNPRALTDTAEAQVRAAERTEVGLCRHTFCNAMLDPCLHSPVAGRRMLFICDRLGPSADRRREPPGRCVRALHLSSDRRLRGLCGALELSPG